MSDVNLSAGMGSHQSAKAESVVWLTPPAIIEALGEALTGTWRAELDAWFAEREDPVSLADLYRAFQNHPKAKANQHWREKLRQALQRGQFERVEKGVWQRRAA